MRRTFLKKFGTVTLNDLLIIARAQETFDLHMMAMGGTVNLKQVNNVTDTGLNGKGDKRGCFNCGRDDHFVGGRRCLLQGVVNVTSVEK